jgi:hypothetical protein
MPWAAYGRKLAKMQLPCVSFWVDHVVMYVDPDSGTSGGMLWDNKIVAIIL